jgi:lipopolysaccharide heptosyltransferase II
MLNFTQMRWMDRHLGGVLCRCFSVVNRLKRWRRRPAEEPLHPQKILVMKYFGLGSLLLASPMVRALRRRFPEARIDLLTIEQNRIIAEVLPIFDNVHTVDTRNLSSVVISMAKALRHIRRERYDVVVDAEFFSRLSTLVSYFARARYSVGFYLPEIWRGNFLTHPVHFNHYRHAVLAFMALAKSLGAESEDYALERLAIPDYVQRNVRAKLQDLGVSKEQRLVCVNVNTGPLSPERRWPEDNFVGLIKRILREFPDIRPILIGARADVPLVRDLHRALDSEERKRVLNVAGEFSLSELCGLLKVSELLITNDSGPLHLAEALRTRSVSFFGPETPQLYGPIGDHLSDRHLVFYKGIYCSPCLNVQNQKKAPCNGNNICMKLIGVEEVFASVRAVLNGVPTFSPFPVYFDLPIRELLIDYRSGDQLPSSTQDETAIATPAQIERTHR